MTPRHTPGHQSFAIECQDGRGWVFAFDAADLAESIEREIAPGRFVHCDAADPASQGDHRRARPAARPRPRPGGLAAQTAELSHS